MRRSRLKLPAKEYKNLCQRVLHRDGWRCRRCKRRNDLHVHHIVYRSHGGDDAEWNLITICSSDHDLIHGLSAAVGRYLFIKPVSGDTVDANGKVLFESITGGVTEAKAA